MARSDNCPTPTKAVWSTRAAAEKAMRSIQQTGYSAVRPQRPYLCDCGGWHLSSQKRRRGKR